LDLARDCKYISKDEHKKLDDEYDKINAMLYRLINNWKTFNI